MFVCVPAETHVIRCGRLYVYAEESYATDTIMNIVIMFSPSCLINAITTSTITIAATTTLLHDDTTM